MQLMEISKSPSIHAGVFPEKHDIDKSFWENINI